MELDRRSFLKGAALLGGSGALVGLVGCSPKDDAGQVAAADDTSKARAEFEAAAKPIDPVEPPSSWDLETDILS